MRRVSGDKSLWLLAALVLLFCVITLAWLRLHRAPPAWDDGWYLTNSLIMYDALGEGCLIGYAHTRRFLSISAVIPAMLSCG